MSINTLLKKYINNSNNIYIIIDFNYKVVFANESAIQYFLFKKESGFYLNKIIKLPDLQQIFSSTQSWEGKVQCKIDKNETYDLRVCLQKIEELPNKYAIVIEILYAEYFNIPLISTEKKSSINSINDSLNNILTSLNTNLNDYTNEETSSTTESKKVKLTKIQSNLKSIGFFFHELTSDIIINFGDESFILFRVDNFMLSIIEIFKSKKKHLEVAYSQPDIELVGIKFQLNYAIKRLIHYLFYLNEKSSSLKVFVEKDCRRNQIIFTFIFKPKNVTDHVQEYISSFKDKLPLANQVIQKHQGTVNVEIKDKFCKLKLILPNQYNLLTELSIQIALVEFDSELSNKIKYCIQRISESIIVNTLDMKMIKTNAASLQLSDIVFINFTYKEFNINQIKEVINFQCFNKKQLFVNCDPDLYYRHENYFIELNISLLRMPIESKKKELIIEIKRKIYLQRQLNVLAKSVAVSKKEAITDGLTGLFNRRYLTEYIHKLKNNIHNKSENFSIIMADIDNFKIYNDTNGHILGDKALKDFANILSTTVRLSDQVIRYGGEEFIIFLKGSDKKTSKKIAEKVRIAVEKYEFDNEQQQPTGTVSASFGVSSFPSDDDNIENLITIADRRLYLAKEQGRNRVIYE